MSALRPIELVEQALRSHGARRVASGNWTCPAHEDRQPSLSVDERQDGAALLNCFAGCAPEAIVAALDLTMADLFAGPGIERAARPRRPASSPADVEDLGAPTEAQVATLIGSRRITGRETLERVGARWVRAYGQEWLGLPTLRGGWKLLGLDGQGKPRRDANGKAVRRNVGPVSLILSPDLAEAGAAGVPRLWDVEGESDFLAAIDQGVCAVITGTGGAPSLAGHDRHREELLALRPTEVVVVRDLDDAGRAGAEKTDAWWLDQGVAVRVLELPAELGEGGDLRDYLLGRLARDGAPPRKPCGAPADLDALADAAPLRRPPGQEGSVTTAPMGDLAALLAGLSELEYQQRRNQLAESAGIGVGALDIVRREARRAARGRATARETEPWPEPVCGEQLAAGIEAALRRFLVLDRHAYTLVSLWIIGTHAYQVRAIYPLLLARSPQPACGKSTLLDVLERLVARPFLMANSSLATLFRTAANGPTQLLDELDRWIDRDPEIIGFLCAGWQSGRPFVRCHPETHELQEFACYGPRALALIGDVLDEALRSRCIAIEMHRALPGERPRRFRAGSPHADLAALQAQAVRWAEDLADTVRAFELGDADLPELSGRAADNAEALLAVAVAVGGAWPTRCREALLGAPLEEPQDLGAMLLADLAILLDEMPDAEAIATSRILEHLLAQEDRPWLTVSKGGKPLEANGLRRRLQPFGIRPTRAYINGTQQRAYLAGPIREAIERYRTPRPPPLPEPSHEVSQVSCRLEDALSEALVAPESQATRQQDTQDTSQTVPGKGGIRGRVAPLAVRSELWTDWRERAAMLEADGVERAEAELRAAEELGLLVAERRQ